MPLEHDQNAKVEDADVSPGEDYLYPGAPLAGYRVVGSGSQEFSNAALKDMETLSDSIRANPVFQSLDERHDAYIETGLEVSPLGNAQCMEIGVTIKLQEPDSRIVQDTAFVRRELIDIAQEAGLSLRRFSLFSTELPEGRVGVTRSPIGDSEIRYSMTVNTSDYQAVQGALKNRVPTEQE
jgi:hypothetical protein